MSSPRISRREFIKLSGASAAAIMTASALPASAAPARQAVTYNEAPMLADLVAQNELPPVNERLPENPLVWDQPDVQAFEKEEGQYGGVLHSLQFRFPNAMASFGLARPSSDWKVFYPDIAESWQWSEDATQLTVKLRKGHKWSDGEPFTAHDIVFWWNEILHAEYLEAPLSSQGLQVDDKITALDDETLQFEFNSPRPFFWPISTGFAGGEYSSWNHASAHYWKQFHPTYNKDPNYSEPAIQFFEKVSDIVTNWQNAAENPEVPVLWAFRTIQFQDGQLHNLERNPYFHVVDRWNNQLPYMDHIESLLLEGTDGEVAKLKMIGGEADWDRRYLSVQDLPLLREHEDEANLDLLLVTQSVGATQAIRFMPGNGDPKMHALLNTPDFRRALSIAVNRPAINETAFFGMGTIGHGFSLPGVYDPEIDGKWAQYDPDLASQMLDAIGLDQRDSEGFRTYPDGSKLTFVLYYWAGWLPGTDETAEISSESWNRIGLRTATKDEHVGTFTANAAAGDPDVCAYCWPDHGGRPERDMKSGNTVHNWAFLQSQWWRDTSTPEEERTGIKPEGEILELLVLEDEALSTTSNERREEIWALRNEILADSVWNIGIVQNLPHVVLTRKNMGNAWGRSSEEAVWICSPGDEQFWPRSWYWMA